MASAGPANSATVSSVPSAARAGWISLSGTVCGTSPVSAGRKNASAVPKHASITATCQISTVAGEDQDGEQRVQAEADQVGGDDHEVARQPVGPDAADQQEADQRHRVAREHDPDVARRADVRDVDRERDEDQPVAECARALAEQQQPEVAVTEQAPHHPP